MAYQGITTETGVADSLFQGALKVNSNFSEIYTALGDGTTINLGNKVVTISGGQVVSGIKTFSDGVVISSGGLTANSQTISAETLSAQGDITATTGNITATTGNITATAGDITATAGNVTAQGNITATTGNITAAAGNITATAGNMTANGVNLGLVNTGFYGDGNNLATRVPNASGGLYIQSPSGASTWQLFSAAGAQVNRLYPLGGLRFSNFGSFPGVIMVQNGAKDDGEVIINGTAQVQIGPFVYVNNVPGTVHLVSLDIAVRTWNPSFGGSRNDTAVILIVKRRNVSLGSGWVDLRGAIVQSTSQSANSAMSTRVHIQFPVATDGVEYQYEYSVFAQCDRADGRAIFHEYGTNMLIYTV